MPPSVVDIVIRAVGEWLAPFVDILLRATPLFAGLLQGTADILLRATPSLGGLSPMVVLSGGFLVLVMGWEMLHEKGG